MTGFLIEGLGVGLWFPVDNRSVLNGRSEQEGSGGRIGFTRWQYIS